VFLALAFLCAIFVTVRLAVRDGLPKERIYDLCLWLLLSSLVGSKLLMLFTEPEYRQNPKLLFSLDFLRSGGVFYGGLIGAIIAAYILMRRWRLPWWKTADACAPGIALGNFFGRQGCFAAGCCWGNECDLPWAVTFRNPAANELTGVPLGVRLHPTQIYEALTEVVIFAFLMWYFKRPHRTGTVIGWYMVLYSIARFAVEFLRHHDQPLQMGLSLTQWISMGTLVFGLWLLVRPGARQTAGSPSAA